ncbi:DUF6252 family protein [Bergeyella zoohelcum]|uniref:Uncharacterized protein n=1 Tax=Bergeyella zoohelcum TaxID=1015 RepID=A0A7Z8YPM9_9FLAO|nr:DUF6252 family protein [Bergeyella zoohelcum]VDH03265.1 Uncharacterised protein [Bergeyella zoohelcum]
MKNLLLALAIGLTAMGCKDREPNPNVLPPATQEGKNTAGCLIDGKIWVASSKYVSLQGGAGNRAYIYKNGNALVQIDLRGVRNKSSIFIRVPIENFQLNKEYILPQAVHIDENICSFRTGEYTLYDFIPSKGKIKITRLDTNKQIISGTFEFEAEDKDGNVVHITEGRFDRKFD